MKLSLAMNMYRALAILTFKDSSNTKITREPAEIIGTQNIGEIRHGFKASLVAWNRDLFSFASYPRLVVAEAEVIHDSR